MFLIIPSKEKKEGKTKSWEEKKKASIFEAERKRRHCKAHWEAKKFIC